MEGELSGCQKSTVNNELSRHAQVLLWPAQSSIYTLASFVDFEVNGTHQACGGSCMMKIDSQSSSYFYLVSNKLTWFHFPVCHHSWSQMGSFTHRSFQVHRVLVWCVWLSSYFWLLSPTFLDFSCGVGLGCVPILCTNRQVQRKQQEGPTKTHTHTHTKKIQF